MEIYTHKPIHLGFKYCIPSFSKVDSISSIQGIGFGDGERNIKYSFFGNEQLDIEKWIPVYQGQNNLGEWHSYELPIGNDWLAWHDSLSNLLDILFINSSNGSSPTGNIFFSLVRDITNDLNIPPSVSIEYEADIQSRRQIASVQFNSVVSDTDSYSFNYLWDFGDGNYSGLVNPNHDYSILYNYNYKVVLRVEDETGMQGFAEIDINLSDENISDPLTLNFCR